LKDLKKFPTPQLFYNQMWLNAFMDDLYLILLGKIKTYNFSKIVHILHNGNNIVKDLMNAFLIHIEFIEIIGKFKQIIFCNLFITCYFKFSFKIFTFNICKL